MLPVLVVPMLAVFIGVAAGVVYAVFVFMLVKFALRFMLAFAFPAVSPPQPANPIAPAQTAASIDPLSLLISFSWENQKSEKEPFPFNPLSVDLEG